MIPSSAQSPGDQLDWLYRDPELTTGQRYEDDKGWYSGSLLDEAYEEHFSFNAAGQRTLGQGATPIKSEDLPSSALAWSFTGHQDSLTIQASSRGRSKVSVVLYIPHKVGDS